MSHSHHLQQKGSHTYDKLFHQQSRPNIEDKRTGNRQILDYRMYAGQYTQDKRDNNGFDEFNENAKYNRNQFFQEQILSESNSIRTFDRTIDNMHVPFDVQRPIATRDQIKGQYEDDNKSLYKHNNTNEYVNEHQFMPSRLGSRYGGGLDFYDVNTSMYSENKNGLGFEKYF